MNEQKELFYSYPAFQNNCIKVRVLTPCRWVYLRELLYKPQSLFLHLAIFFSIVELGLQHFERGTLFIYLPNIKPWMLISYISGVFAFHIFERQTRYAIARFLFGKTIKIVFEPNKIAIRNGFSRSVYERDLGLSFCATKIDASEFPAYIKAGRNFCIILGDHRVIKLAEIWDVKLANRLANNCNAALRVTQDVNRTPDLDPRELALQA